MHLKACMALACVLAMASSHASVQSTTVPNAFADVPGTGTFLGPLANSARTYQLLINESQLSEHLGNTLTGISFRLPGAAGNDWPGTTITFSDYDIRLSGSVAPADRSLTFADNIVGSQTLVRSGSLTVTPGSFESGSAPNPFGMGIGFDTGYLYSGGHLLIEIRHTGFSGTSQGVDAMIATGGAANGYGTLFSAAWGSSYTALNGPQGNFAVLQVTSVPEPATALLLAAGVAALMMRRRTLRASQA